VTVRERAGAVLLTLITVVYAIIPLIAGIGPTHIFLPAWGPHGRFHVVWQLSTTRCWASSLWGSSGGLDQAKQCDCRLARCRAASCSEASSWQRSHAPFMVAHSVSLAACHRSQARAPTSSPLRQRC